MNKVYRTVWNEHTNTWVAVQETAKAHRKSGVCSSVVSGVLGDVLLNKKVLAISTSVAAAFMSQAAMADPARIQNGSAQSTIAISPSDSTAGSGSAKATAEGSIAAGRDAKADGKNSISLGSEASTETNSATYYRIKNVPDKTENNIAIGTKARSGGLQTIAFGAESVASKSQSIAFGFDAQATGDQSVALGANTRSMGDSSVAIGGDDLDSVASTVYRATSASADNDAYNDTPLAQKYRELTGQNLVNFTPGNRYIGTSTGQAGVAVGVSAKAADLATAVGTKSHATGDYSVAFGVGANAELANAVALGAGSTTKTNATDVASATIGSITYGSSTSPFAGSGKVGAGDQVSVGAAGFERQIKHVAPGDIAATSTDAINGSQLFYVTQGLQNQIGSLGFGVNADNNSLKTHQLGKELAIVAGNTTESTSTDNLKTNVVQDAATGKTTVTVSMKEAPTFSSVTTQDAAGNKTVTNAGGVTITPVSGSPVSLTKDGLNNGGNKITGVADGNIAAGSKEAINGGQLHDLKENGFKIAADNGTPDTVKLTETVKYTGDSNVVTTVKDNEIGFKLADSITVGPATGGNPVKIDGNAGTVTGLTNKTWDPNNITSGRGATEDQLKAAQAAATSKVAAGNGISVTPNVDATTGSTTYTVAADTTTLNVGDGTGGNPAGKVITPTGADANKLATAGDIANAINNSGFNINAGGNVVGTSTATTAKPGSTLTLKAGDGLTVKQELDGQGNQSYTYALDAQSVVQNAQTPVVYTKADGTKVYKHTDGNFYDAPNGAGTQVAAGDVIASMQNAAGSTTAPTTLANVKGNLADTSNATGNPSGNDRATLAAGNKGNNAATVNDVLNAGFTVQGNGTDKDFVTHGDTINFANGQGTVANVSTTGGVTTVKFDTPMTYADAAGNPTTTPSNKVNLVGGTAGSPVTLGNVAPGTLSATSTEAVNGSQLYATNQNVAKGINFGGTTGSNNYQLGDTINVKGDNNITSTTVTGGAQLALNPNLSVTSVTATDAAGNQTVTNGGGVTITPAAGGGNPVSLTTGGLNNGGNKITNVANGTAPNDVVNLSQLQAMGSAAKTHYYSVNSSQQAAGSNYNNDGATGTDALAAGVKAQAAQRNSIAIGNEAKVENSPANPSSSSIAIGDKAKAQGDLALAIGPGATVSGESAAGGIAIGSAATSNNGGMAVGSGANAGNGTPMIPGLPVRLNNNVALGDSAKVKDDTNFRVALGSFSIAGESDLTAAPYKPTANANVAGIAGSGVELGEVSVGGDNTAGMGKTLYRRVTNVAAGAADTDAVNVSQLKAAQAAATSKVAAGNGISVTPNVDATTGSTTYTVAADTTTLNVGDGTGGNPAGKVITPTGADANKLATAGDIANAINNSGFNINAGGNVVGTSTATTAKPGSTLTLKAGDGLTVKQELDGQGNQSYTYALDAQSVVQNAQTPVVYTKADGTKVYKHTDGNFYDAPNGAGTQVAAGDVIASMQNAAGSTTAPTTLANVKGNLADTSNATGNPSGNDRATLAAGNKGNNAATVNDVLNAGFTVQGNGTDKDFVTHGDTINFANGQGTVANVSTTGGVTTVKFDTPMTYADAAGNPTTTPSNKVNLVGGTAGSPVTLGNVAPGTLSATSTEAVNGSQLYATNQNVAKGINFGGTTGSNNYQLGDTINVKGDNNITSTTVTGGAQLALNPNLSVTSVTATDAAGNQTVTNGGGVTITPAAGGGNPVSLTTGGLNNGGNKITNVADGTAGTDAVNVSQLNAALGAINGVGNANIAVLDAKINDVANTANAGVAQAIATAGLPQAYLPGKNMVAVGGGYYKGEAGYAVGFSTISDSGNWIIKATGSGNSRGNFGASIGAGYQW